MSGAEPPATSRRVLNAIAVVAALGYFVDVYDLILFGIVRVPSVTALGYSGAEAKAVGVMLLDLQMIGTLVGGILWGVLGDRRGRQSVLYASILTYSLATGLNGFVTGVEAYAVLRFIAGVGLAGELGVGITLVAETMSKESRGWGTTLVAAFGGLGAGLAFLVAEASDWRVAYWTGGVLGLALLGLRVATYESSLFKRVHASRAVGLGRFDLLFRRPKRLLKYLASIGVGLPITFSIGVLMFLADHFGGKPGPAIMWCYLGMVAGDVVSGLTSQALRSRKQAIAIFLALTAALDATYLFAAGGTESFYGVCFLVGFSAGYWVLFVTMASEQFGTDIRATVTTTAPNFVRGLLAPLTSLFLALEAGMGAASGGAVVLGLCLVVAVVSLWSLRETFGKDLDYLEE